MPELPLTIEHTADVLPFEWRVTKADKSLKVEAGIEFEPREMFAGDDGEEDDAGNITQIAVSVLMAASRLLGLTHDESVAVVMLAVKMGGKVDD